MASLTRTETGKVMVRWRDPDGTEVSRTCPDMKTARALKLAAERARALGKRWRDTADLGTPPDLTYARDVYARHRSARKSAGTVASETSAINKFIAWCGPKGRRVIMLTNTRLLAFDDHMRRSGSFRTANLYTATVRRWWEWLSTKDEFTDFLKPPPPFEALDLPEIAWFPPAAPTWSEMDQAIDKAEGWVKLALSFMRYTGIRQGQVMQLVWADVDVDEATLTIRPELGKTVQERAGRTIPISGFLADLLAETPRQWGNWIIEPGRRNRRLDRRAALLAWEATDVRRKVWDGHPHHAFRYGFTSGLKALGADRESSEYLIGHSVRGARAYYLDPTWALRLRETVDLIPRIGAVTEMRAEVG